MDADFLLGRWDTKKRLVSLIAVILPLGIVLAACQSIEPADAPKVKATEKLTIAWIPKALNNPVFEVGREGAFKKAEELTAAGPIEVEVLYVGSVTSDAAEQTRVVEDVIAKGVDAIGISCNDMTDGVREPHTCSRAWCWCWLFISMCICARTANGSTLGYPGCVPSAGPGDHVRHKSERDGISYDTCSNDSSRHYEPC